MRIAIVVPHIFMNDEILPDVIFSPGFLAIDLANGLKKLGNDVTLFTPGRVECEVNNINADLKHFNEELSLRGDTYLELLKKHPLVFISLSRIVQSELISKAFKMANEDKFDIVHIYTNEEELGIVFSDLCDKPVVFTHHEPFNFLAKYRSIFPKYKNRNYISISNSQRKSMPNDTHFIKTIYHGLPKNKFKPNYHIDKSNEYMAYFGRIIEPKGVHLAIEACIKAHVKLKIAGKHYSGFSKDSYWNNKILPFIDNDLIEFVGFIKDDKAKENFLGNAKALLIPSIWEEPFGMVMIESLACGTPVIGLNNGAIPEVIDNNVSGLLANNDENVINSLVNAINNINKISRKTCRSVFQDKYTSDRMCSDYIEAYKSLV